MIPRFFIDRPIFATVLSIIITLGGAIAVFTLPVAQYSRDHARRPSKSPPSFPGANAKVVAETVAAPIEQQVNGVEDMMYMSSQCTNDGSYTLTVTFKPGTDLNIAQVLVQNRVSLALPVLPELVKRRGVTVKKKSPSVLMIVNLFSPDGSYNNLDLSNYATIQLRDELARLKGVGDISYLGQRDYSMRIWLNPEKMAALNLSPGEVLHAVEQQNIQVAAGQIGQPPAPSRQAFQYTINTLGRLSSAEQFADITVKSEGGRLVRLKDVARIELGALGYDQNCTMDGQPSVALSIYQLPGTNALETARSVRDKMEELKQRFPKGVDYAIVYDTTPFIQESVNEVFHTLRDAVILVAIVMLVFLQSWRTAIIPLAAVPVAVIGTFAAMAGAGFSINNLTLFGLVLAIGIVVDDAIVVVEAVEHHLEEGMSPRDATIKAMDEVAGPVIAIGLVLAAVFVPCMFITGIIGQFFQQFAVTIAISTLISAFNSLTLSPALCALLLKKEDKTRRQPLPRLVIALIGGWIGYAFLTGSFERGMGELGFLQGENIRRFLPWIARGLAAAAAAILLYAVSAPINFILGYAFRTFNQGFGIFTAGYIRVVGVLIRATLLGLLAYGGLLLLTWRVFTETPTGFIPQQDKGYLLVNVQLPDAAALSRTDRIMKQAEAIALRTRGVKHTVGVSGQSLLLGANSPNFGSVYVMLDEFPNRVAQGRTADVIARELQEAFEEITDATVQVFGAPPVDGLGTAGGFKLVVEDRGGDPDPTHLETVAKEIIADGNRRKELRDLYTGFGADTPWLFLRVDREAASIRGVSFAEIDAALQIFCGSYYVNDFNRFGRTWQVNLQGDLGYRDKVEALLRSEVLNDRREGVPLRVFVKAEEVNGPVLVQRYNLYASAAINGNPAAGTSSGEAITTMERVSADKLPLGTRGRMDRTGALAIAGRQHRLLRVPAVGRARLPRPRGAVRKLGAAAGRHSRGADVPVVRGGGRVGDGAMDINIFTQVGLVVLVGLASKNAILIVEFAKQRGEAGLSRREATLEACRLRLRPIIMTSFAFILGVLPLVLSEGAGAEMRRLLGTAVFYGMLGVTLFGILLTPIFFYAIRWLTDPRKT